MTIRTPIYPITESPEQATSVLSLLCRRYHRRNNGRRAELQIREMESWVTTLQRNTVLCATPKNGYRIHQSHVTVSDFASKIFGSSC